MGKYLPVSKYCNSSSSAKVGVGGLSQQEYFLLRFPIRLQKRWKRRGLYKFLSPHASDVYAYLFEYKRMPLYKTCILSPFLSSWTFLWTDVRSYNFTTKYQTSMCFLYNQHRHVPRTCNWCCPDMYVIHLHRCRHGYFLFPCMGNSSLNFKHSIIGTCVFASLLLRMQLSVFSVDIADVKFVVKLHRWQDTERNILVSSFSLCLYTATSLKTCYHEINNQNLCLNI